MSTTLKVRLKHAEGSILRLLGQVGRRGYDVLGVTARLSQDGKTFDVLVEFEPFLPLAPGKPRPVEVLPALVRKLCDVESAELVASPRPAGETPGNGGSHAKVPNPESKAK
jgi:acetolactate synthase regulatory subunit